MHIVLLMTLKARDPYTEYTGSQGCMLEMRKAIASLVLLRYLDSQLNGTDPQGQHVQGLIAVWRCWNSESTVAAPSLARKPPSSLHNETCFARRPLDRMSRRAYIDR